MVEFFRENTVEDIQKSIFAFDPSWRNHWKAADSIRRKEQKDGLGWLVRL